jgi:hypothetical protein
MRQVSEDQFKKVRETLSRADSAVKRVPISAISVDDRCLQKDQILVNGEPVKIGRNFLSKLGSMLKLNRSLTRDMINRGDHRLAATLINGLKDYESKNRKERDVMLIANLESREVVDICPPNRYRRATNDTVLDMTERILNDNPNLIIETVDYNANTGGTSINLLNQDEIGFAKAGKDEFFKFGFSIVQTTKDTLAESYNQRLICSNGLRTSLGSGAIGGNSQIQFEDRFRLGGTSSEDIKIFLNKVEDMRKRGFVNPQFENQINRAVGTKASMSEVEKAWKLANSRVNELDPELKKQYQASLARQWFSGYGDALARVNRKGVDGMGLQDRQKQFIKTNMSIWDVVNSLTFLGSNNSGIDLNNQHELKYAAGDLFSKGVKEGYDLEFAQFASL